MAKFVERFEGFDIYIKQQRNQMWQAVALHINPEDMVTAYQTTFDRALSDIKINIKYPEED